jgi:diaminohydroxyphosphoribosylaminopyrimidine deaminase/5-amino-6-(5-phosphoribosylamino)uracil reductase
VLLRTRDPHEALADLRAGTPRRGSARPRGRRAGGRGRAGLVDEVVAYVAPVLLGAGTSAVADLGITTISAALRPVVTDVTVLEPATPDEQPNVRLTMTPDRSAAAAGHTEER